MSRAVLLVLAIAVLTLAWFGPLPDLAPHRFSAHMAMHMGVVAVASPLLALGLAGGAFDPARRWPRLFSAIPASALELAIVSAWHAPVLHQLARTTTGGLVAEQCMFLLAGFFVWMSSCGGDLRHDASRAGSGVVALLLTSMHMTLLGALIALSPRPLYMSHEAATALHEQHLGGAIMLVVGGVAYLAGGVGLGAVLLRRRPLCRSETA
jgi:putative membrane protein